MNEPGQDTVKSIFDYLSLTLRYVASGFVAVIVIGFLDPEFKNYCNQTIGSAVWILIFIAATIGVFIYAIHYAYLDRIFYNISVFLYQLFYNLPLLIRNERDAWSASCEKPRADKWLHRLFIAAVNRFRCQRRVIFVLKSQTYLRKASVGEAKKFQDNLENKLALLVFLYCSIYSMIVIPAFYYFAHCKLHQGKDWKLDMFALNTLIIFGIVLIVVALTFDFRITKREMWLVHYHPQFIPNLKRNVQFRFDAKEFAKSYNYKLIIDRVQIATDSIGWRKVDCKLSEDKSYWSAWLECPTGIIHFKFVLNGEYWINQPKDTDLSTDPDSNINNFRFVI